MTEEPRKAKRIVIQQAPRQADRVRGRCLPGYSTPKMYTPADYRKWKQAVADEIASRPLGPPYEGPVQVWVRFAVPRPKTTKLDAPKPDIDNYLKALFDAMTTAGNVWKDDCQVHRVMEASKVWTEQPTGGIVVTVMPLGEPCI